MAKASDFWSSIDKTNYHEDGTMKQEYRDFLLSEGVYESRIAQYEELKKRQIEQFEEREQMYFKEYGITYSDLTVQRGGKVQLDF